ncbi:hypothetical protein FOG51_03831 [Hanseniaspora uvarum]|nr:hypothetical protein FOG51_03831 [Hanseniaspora uvarum]
MESDKKRQKISTQPDLSKPFKEIKLRKPLKFQYSPEFVDSLKAENIKETFKSKHDELLLVEKLVAGGYGSGTQRFKMTFDEFYKRLNNGEQLYLSTQYLMDDPDSNMAEFEDDSDGNESIGGFGDNPELLNGLGSDFEDDYVVDAEDDEDDEGENPEEMIERVEDIFQRPMQKLIHKLPLKFEFTDKLILQQINLWMGSSAKVVKYTDKDFEDLDQIGKKVPNGYTSTGLHHDHADNIYIPVEGHKRFTLFPPSLAKSLYTVGDVEKVFENGIIDYKMNEKAPNWVTVNANGSQLPDLEPFNQGKMNHKVDPPSFSKINPLFLHLDEIVDDNIRAKLHEKGSQMFPEFFKDEVLSQRIIIDLSPGDVLYLPAGWFHEVSSRGKYHIACNYWFVPPDNFDDEKMYKDDLIYDIDAMNQKAIDFYKMTTEEEE